MENDGKLMAIMFFFMVWIIVAMIYAHNVQKDEDKETGTLIVNAFFSIIYLCFFAIYEEKYIVSTVLRSFFLMVSATIIGRFFGEFIFDFIAACVLCIAKIIAKIFMPMVFIGRIIFDVNIGRAVSLILVMYLFFWLVCYLIKPVAMSMDWFLLLLLTTFLGIGVWNKVKKPKSKHWLQK